MDGISGAATVIGLVQCAAQVTTALRQYVSRVKEAESSRAKLIDQIRLILAAEKAIEKVVQNSSHSLRAPELQIMIDEWFKDDGPPAKCKKELEKLLTWLEGQTTSSRYKRFAKRITWPTKEDKVEGTIRAFERYMPYFCGIISLETFNVVENIATRYKNTEATAEKSKLLRWLDGFDCTTQFESTLRQRQKTTGRWIFKEQVYIDWRQGSTKFVWLHGKAGAGKSVLASAIINDLLNGLDDDETLAYFYCNFRNIRCTSAMEVLRSATKQLLWNSKIDWLHSFSDLIGRSERGTGPPTDLDTLSDLLQRAAGLHKRPIIVIDALDECEDLSNLLDELKNLANGHCRLFVTSRTLIPIEEAFTDLPAIPLNDRVDEMLSDMHSHIKTELESRLRLKILTRDLKEEIHGVLIKKAGGMFRWVQCQLDRLNDCYSLGDVREVLDTLPDTLYETYNQMLRVIDKKPFGSRIALRALTWLVMSLRPLTLSELKEALTISCDKPAWDSSHAPIHENVILEILGSLVTVETRQNERTITLSHYSVKEYLTSDTLAHSIYFVHHLNASLALAKASVFSVILLAEGSITISVDTMRGLIRYALQLGFRHLADCHSDHNESLIGNLLTLQDNQSTFRLALQCDEQDRGLIPRLLLIEDDWWPFDWMNLTPQFALCIILRFGNVSMLRHYLDHHSVQVTEKFNPLTFAALYSDIPRFQLLLEKGLDVDLEGPSFHGGSVQKLSPLIATTQNRTPEYQEQLARLLLAKGCVIPKNVMNSILPGRKFIFSCNPAIVRIFLEHGADAQSLTTGNQSYLHSVLNAWAMHPDDQREIAHMLVAAGCDPKVPDDFGVYPLHLAMQSLSVELVEWLIKCGSPVPSDAILYALRNLGLHPPGVVASERLPYILRLLIASGALPGVQDTHGYNPLHLFLMHERYLFDDEPFNEVVHLLVEHGCDINCHSDAGESPLHLAAAFPSFPHLLNLLLAHGATLPTDIINYVAKNYGQLAQHRGLGHEHANAILTTLVKEFGASCRSWTVGGDNALHCLLSRRLPTDRQADSGHEATMKAISVLVTNGCSMHAPNSSGDTPLQVAIENDNLSLARTLLARVTVPDDVGQTKPYHGDMQGNGILHRLCQRLYSPFEDQVKLLQESGYKFTKDINRPNNQGFTPLCITLNAQTRPAGRLDTMVSCLLDLGADFHHVNYLHMDSIEWASNLSWYPDAIDAHERCLSRSKVTFSDITRAYHLLQAADQSRLPPPICRSILDIAEYWACTEVTKHNIRAVPGITGFLGTEQIVLPTVPVDHRSWRPRRLVFSGRGGVFGPSPRVGHASIEVRIMRSGIFFTVPISPGVFSQLERVGLDVWDDSAPALQVNGRQRLTVGELMPGDILRVDFEHVTDDYFVLEFFRVQVYYSIATKFE